MKCIQNLSENISNDKLREIKDNLLINFDKIYEIYFK